MSQRIGVKDARISTHDSVRDGLELAVDLRVVPGLDEVRIPRFQLLDHPYVRRIIISFEPSRSSARCYVLWIAGYRGLLSGKCAQLVVVGRVRDRVRQPQPLDDWHK